jgi:predicted dehydrogenase
VAQSVDDATQLITAARVAPRQAGLLPVTLLLPTAQRWRHVLQEGTIGNVTFARAQLLTPPIWDDFPRTMCGITRRQWDR